MLETSLGGTRDVHCWGSISLCRGGGGRGQSMDKWIRLPALGASGFLECCLGSRRTAGFPEQ